MRRSLTVVVLILSVISVAVLSASASTQWWQKINWNAPVSWPQRLTGLKLAPQPPAKWAELQPIVALEPNKTTAVGGYILPEGWQEAVKGVKTLSFFNFGSLKGDPAILFAIAKFEELTGIHIIASPMEETGLWLKTVAAMLAHKSSPQLIQITPGLSLSTVVASGWATNLDWFWPSEVRALYAPALDMETKVDGHYWASGTVSFKPFVLYYRPSLLKQVLGSSAPPKTYQELFQMAKTIAEKTGKYGLAFPGKDYRYFRRQLEGPLFSLGGRLVSDDNRVSVLTPQFKEVFTYFVNMVREGGIPKTALGWSWTDAPDIFARGEAAFYIGGTTYITNWTNNPPAAIKGDWDVVPPLSWAAGDPRATATSPAVWCINPLASDAEKCAAALFLDLYRSYMTQWNEAFYEGNETIVPALYDLPSAQKALPRPEVSKEAVKAGVDELLPPNGDYMTQAILQWWQKAALGQVSIDEALKNLQSEIDQYQP